MGRIEAGFAGAMRGLRLAQDRRVLCLYCGYVGDPITVTPGSFMVELVLWLFMFIPGFIYGLWRLAGRREICPVCERTYALAPLHGRAAQHWLAQRRARAEDDGPHAVYAEEVTP